MAESADVIELGSSDEEPEPAAKKPKRLNAMVSIPDSLPEISVIKKSSVQRAQTQKVRVASSVQNLIKNPYATKHLQITKKLVNGKPQKVNQPVMSVPIAVSNSALMKNAVKNTISSKNLMKVHKSVPVLNTGSIVNVKSMAKANVKGKVWNAGNPLNAVTSADMASAKNLLRNLHAVNAQFKNIRAPKIPVLGQYRPPMTVAKQPNFNPTFVQRPPMVVQSPPAQGRGQKCLTTLPPGITVTRVSGQPKKHRTKRAPSPAKVTFKKQKLDNAAPTEVLTVELDDDEEPPAQPTTSSPQWYVRPEEAEKPKELKPTEQEVSAEVENNKEPEEGSKQMIEITIEDSPIKPPPVTHASKMVSDLSIIIEDSPRKPDEEAQKADEDNYSSSDGGDDVPNTRHSKKKLNFPKKSTELIEIEVEFCNPIPDPPQIGAIDAESNSDKPAKSIEKISNIASTDPPRNVSCIQKENVSPELVECEETITVPAENGKLESNEKLPKPNSSDSPKEVEKENLECLPVSSKNEDQYLMPTITKFQEEDSPTTDAKSKDTVTTSTIKDLNPVPSTSKSKGSDSVASTSKTNVPDLVPMVDQISPPDSKPSTSKIKNSDLKSSSSKSKESDPKPTTSKSKDSDPKPSSSKSKDSDPKPSSSKIKESYIKPGTSKSKDSDSKPSLSKINNSDAKSSKNKSPDLVRSTCKTKDVIPVAGTSKAKDRDSQPSGKKSKDPDHVPSTSGTRQVLQEFNETYQEFIDLCLKMEQSEDMKKIVDKKVKEYYRQVDKSFTHSEDFVGMVSSKIKAIKLNPENLYLYIKDIVDELKIRRKQKGKSNVKETTKEKPKEDEPYSEGGDEGEGSDRNARNIRKLEKTLRKLHRSIQKLEEQEVDFDDETDSVYLLTESGDGNSSRTKEKPLERDRQIQIERYKERLVRVHAKLCQLTGTKMPSEAKVSLEARPGRPQGPTLKLEGWINKKVPMGAPLPFPDFHDVVRCVREANEEDRLGWGEVEIMEEARDLFSRCGKKLQKRRQLNEWRIAASRIEATADPATESPELQHKLTENKRIAAKREIDVINKYADRQNVLQLEAKEIGENEIDESAPSSDDEVQAIEDDDSAKPKTVSPSKEHNIIETPRLTPLIVEVRSMKEIESNSASKESNISKDDCIVAMDIVKENGDCKNQKRADDAMELSDGTEPRVQIEDTTTQDDADKRALDTESDSEQIRLVLSEDDNSNSAMNSNDQHSLLQQRSDAETIGSSLEPSDTDAPIAISDTQENSGDRDALPVSSGVVSIENSTYSESERDEIDHSSPSKEKQSLLEIDESDEESRKVGTTKTSSESEADVVSSAEDNCPVNNTEVVSIQDSSSLKDQEEPNLSDGISIEDISNSQDKLNVPSASHNSKLNEECSFKITLVSAVNKEKTNDEKEISSVLHNVDDSKQPHVVETLSGDTENNLSHLESVDDNENDSSSANKNCDGLMDIGPTVIQGEDISMLGFEVSSHSPRNRTPISIEVTEPETALQIELPSDNELERDALLEHELLLDSPSSETNPEVEQPSDSLIAHTVEHSKLAESELISKPPDTTAMDVDEKDVSSHNKLNTMEIELNVQNTSSLGSLISAQTLDMKESFDEHSSASQSTMDVQSVILPDVEMTSVPGSLVAAPTLDRNVALAGD